MKSSCVISQFFFSLGITSLLPAQVQLPLPSPKCITEQVVGLTTVRVEYSRPGVKGRKIFGELVPFNQVWRTGANEATSISFSRDVTFGDKKLPAGEYALFTIPNPTEWILIFNTNEGQKGSVNYKESLDVLRLSARPELCDFTERFLIEINPINDEEGELALRWERTRVAVRFRVNTVEQARKNIEEFYSKFTSQWYDLAQAARYGLENNVAQDKLLDMVNRSISLRDHFFNKYVKAKILYRTGKTAEARALMNEAREWGEKNPSPFYEAYKADIEKCLKEW
ncbi:MAG: DUF2911 domain-containing protein [Flavobacteriales bacterium]|nr:DUF2911 domain-containing protein [Flavobacteriales bacterium]MCX7767718.1 DUF2911 domain-containing protein [Flavobacteriales bacterium]MDW8409387.1 DUF2911 domain-containing protein [Flavobacteriales bacterium]